MLGALRLRLWSVPRGVPLPWKETSMPRDEKQWHVVLPTQHGKLVAPPTACTDAKAAEEVVDESRANDPYGWHADYEVRPMTASELAFMLQP